MAAPLGIIANQIFTAQQDGSETWPPFGKLRHGSSAGKLFRKTRSSEDNISKESPKKWRPLKKHQKSLSGRTLLPNKRARANQVSALQSNPYLVETETSLGRASDVRDASSPGTNTPQSKHVSIRISDYGLVRKDGIEGPSDACATSHSLTSNSSNLLGFDSVTRKALEEPEAAPTESRHAETQIPSLAQPLLRRPSTAPRVHLSQSFFVELSTTLGGERVEVAPLDMSRPAPDSGQASSMEFATSTGTANRLYANSNHSSYAHLGSANSSASSLVGRRDEYESSSEAESVPSEEQPGTNTPSQALNGPSPSAVQPPTSSRPGATTANLSGLVCNVHRTTGKEPPPLVGATTTVLGDKLYVFGGRRLSRTNPTLTSNLYELDLIHRHWTKIDVRGTVPPPRYFHSLCTLGDTMLVCYGGMSSAPTADGAPNTQAEVVVMSDIHVYDVRKKKWSKIDTTDSPQGRYAHCAAILPSSAVFASTNAARSAIHHNLSSSNPNQGTLGVTFDGTGGAEMVVVGGQDSANHYIEQVSVFNLRSLKWTGTTGMGRSCGAYRSVVTPLTSMSASQIGAGPHTRNELEEDEDESSIIGSGAPMLIYSNYNFLDVKLELQVRLTDGTLTEKPMQTGVSPPGLRFPNGGVIDNHFVVSGTFLTSSKQEYALWALDLRTLAWSRIDAGGSIFSEGSWNRGVLWNRRNAFVILGNRKRNLVDDYNNRRINFSNMCVVELEAFGLYENPRHVEPCSGFVSASASNPAQIVEVSASGRQLLQAAEDLGTLSLGIRELGDMEFLAIDGTRVPVNSRLIARRWGKHFTNLLKESLTAATDADTATLRPTGAGHASRNSSITITPSVNSGSTLTGYTAGELPDVRSAPPSTRSRLFYLPHTAPTLQALLHYLYTSTLPSSPSPLATPQIFCSLLQLARPYNIDGLLEAVVERLHESLDGRNAAAIFNAAAMGAGGGESVQFASGNASSRESTIPLRTASLAGIDTPIGNGVARMSYGLRVDTGLTNGRSTRDTLRPGQPLPEGAEEDDLPGSAATDESLSESDTALSVGSLPERDPDRRVWNGALSSVVGLQKRGLRGLMEGRRLRERGRRDGSESGGGGGDGSAGPSGAQVGLGIA